MGTVINMEQWKEMKAVGNGSLSMGFAEETAGPSASSVVVDNGIEDYAELVEQLKGNVPMVLNQVYNLMVFRKVSGLEDFVTMNFSTNPMSPTVVPVDHPGIMADVSPAAQLLIALCGVTIRVALDEEVYYISLQKVQ